MGFSFGVAAQASQFFGRVSAGGSANILVVSDSTAAGQGLWPDLVSRWLAKRHPSHRTFFAQWNQKSERYDPAQERGRIRAADRGARPRICVYNLAIGGKTTDYALGCIPAGVAEVNPDLILISLGLNEASTSKPPPDRDQYRAQYLALTETLAATAPSAGMVLVLQNPEATSSVMSVRNAEYGRVARLLRCAVVDVHGAFLARQNGATRFMRDARHPNSAGQRLWARQVTRALGSNAEIGDRPRRRSSLLPSRGSQLLECGHVARWNAAEPDHPGIPPGWSPHNVAISFDPEGRPQSSPATCPADLGCVLSAVDPEQASWLESRITGERLARIRGQRITVSARVLVPSVALGSTAGLLEIDDHREGLFQRPQGSDFGGSPVQRSRGATLRPGSFVWVCATRAVHPRSPGVSIRLYATLGGSGPSQVVLDRMTAVPGFLPRDLIEKPLTR